MDLFGSATFPGIQSKRDVACLMGFGAWQDRQRRNLKPSMERHYRSSCGQLLQAHIGDHAVPLSTQIPRCRCGVGSDGIKDVASNFENVGPEAIGALSLWARTASACSWIWGPRCCWRHGQSISPSFRVWCAASSWWSPLENWWLWLSLTVLWSLNSDCWLWSCKAGF